MLLFNSWMLWRKCKMKMQANVIEMPESLENLSIKSENRISEHFCQRIDKKSACRKVLLLTSADCSNLSPCASRWCPQTKKLESIPLQKQEPRPHNSILHSQKKRKEGMRQGGLIEDTKRHSRFRLGRCSGVKISNTRSKFKWISLDILFSPYATFSNRDFQIPVLESPYPPSF